MCFSGMDTGGRSFTGRGAIPRGLVSETRTSSVDPPPRNTMFSVAGVVNRVADDRGGRDEHEPEQGNSDDDPVPLLGSGSSSEFTAGSCVSRRENCR